MLTKSKLDWILHNHFSLTEKCFKIFWNLSEVTKVTKSWFLNKLLYGLATQNCLNSYLLYNCKPNAL